MQRVAALDQVRTHEVRREKKEKGRLGCVVGEWREWIFSARTGAKTPDSRLLFAVIA